jgi:hypothetical protein
MCLLRLLRQVRGFDGGLSKVKDSQEAARMMGRCTAVRHRQASPGSDVFAPIE